MQAELDALRKELARSEQELADLNAEAGRRRASSGTWASGFAVVDRSDVLFKAKWNHDSAIGHLEERMHGAQHSTPQPGDVANRSTSALQQ